MRRVLMAFLAFTVLLNVAAAQIGGGQSLIISDLKITPEDVHPGDNFTLSFKVINAWGADKILENVYVHLEGGYPFLKISPTQPQRLRGLGYDIDWWVSRGAEVSYNLSVDPTAVAGVYTLNAVFSYTRYSEAVGTRGGNERFTEVYPIAIKVVGEPEVEVYIKSSQPEKPQPGDTVTLSLKVANLGNDYARNVLLYVGELPHIAPEWNSRVVYIGDVAPEGSANAHITLETSSELLPDEYLLPIGILYQDGSDRWVKKNSSIKLTIRGVEELEVYVESSKPAKPKPGDDITLILKVVNYDSLPVKEAVLEIGDANGLEPLWSSRRIYLGDIPAKGSIQARVELEADENATTGEHILPMKIFSRDVPTNIKSSIGVTLHSEADFEIKPVQNLVKAGESEQRVSFTLKNTGTEAAKEIRLTLRANYPFTPVGNEYYIERLAPGEEAIAEFHVDVDSDAAGQRYPIDVVIKWKEDEEEQVKVKYSYVEVLKKERKIAYYVAALLGGIILLAALIRLRKRK